QPRAGGGVAVGRVGVEVMEPEELLRAARGVDLGEGGTRDLGREPVIVLLRVALALPGGSERALGEVLVEAIEPAAEPEARREREGADDGGRREARAAQDLGDRGRPAAEAQAVAGEPVLPG